MKIIARDETQNRFHLLTYAPLNRVPVLNDIADLKIKTYRFTTHPDAFPDRIYLDNQPVQPEERYSYEHSRQYRADNAGKSTPEIWKPGDYIYTYKVIKGERFPPGHYVFKILGVDRATSLYHCLIYSALNHIPTQNDIPHLEKKTYHLFANINVLRPVYLDNRPVTEEDINDGQRYPISIDRRQLSWNVGDLFYAYKGTEGKLFPPGYYVHKIIACNEEKHILHVLTYAPLDHIPTKDDISDLDIRAYHLPHDGNAYFHATYLDNRPVEEHELQGYHFHNEMRRNIGRDEI